MMHAGPGVPRAREYLRTTAAVGSPWLTLLLVVPGINRCHRVSPLQDD